MKKIYPVIPRVAGLLFLVPLLAYAGGEHLMNSVLHSREGAPISDLLRFKLAMGTMLLFVNSFIVMGIGIILLPVIGAVSQNLAYAYFGARMTESVMLLIGVISVVIALTVDLQDNDVYQNTLMSIAQNARHWTYQIAMLFLGIGSIGFCFVLIRQRLVPVLLAYWGMAGYGLLATGAVLECFGFQVGLLLSIPGGLFEIVLGVCLLAGNQRFGRGSWREVFARITWK